MLDILIYVLVVALTVIAVIPTVYYFLLFCVYILTKQSDSSGNISSESKIIILIPAHNEEYTLQKTLNSCALLEYPEDLYDVNVIADNCDDETKNIAIKNETKVLERFNELQRGKGYALEWAFNEIINIDYDAVIIVDADCELSANALTSLDYYLKQGCQALQLNDISSNPDASPLSYILSVGNFIENEYFYYPKNLLKLAIQCRGTGMAFTKKLLHDVPWNASTITEDMEYSVSLFRNGVNVTFIKEAFVQSEFPDTDAKFVIQRTRWAQGNLGYTRSNALNLLKEGIKVRSLLLFDTGLTLYMLSKPLILSAVFVSFIVSLFSYMYLSDSFMLLLLLFNIFSFSVIVLYFVSAILLYGLSMKRIRYLFYVPKTILSLIKVSINGIKNNDDESWNKTPRK